MEEAEIEEAATTQQLVADLNQAQKEQAAATTALYTLQKDLNAKTAEAAHVVQKEFDRVIAMSKAAAKDASPIVKIPMPIKMPIDMPRIVRGRPYQGGMVAEVKASSPVASFFEVGTAMLEDKLCAISGSC